MKHAHEIGVNEGVTRAMVIRAYPRPWHIFVDLSPNTNADFEVAATFDKEPTMDEGFAEIVKVNIVPEFKYEQHRDLYQMYLVEKTPSLHPFLLESKSSEFCSFFG